jgi:hypothetical protein
MAISIQEQIRLAFADLQGFVRNLFLPDTWVRGWTAVFVVGLGFTFLLVPLLMRIPGVGKFAKKLR